MNGHEWNPLREESCGRKANSVERVPDGDDKWIWMSPRLTAAKLILAFGREEKSTQSITATETDLTSVNSLYTCKCSMKLTPAHSRTVNWILI